MKALAQLCLEAYYTLKVYKMLELIGCLTDGTSFYYYKFCTDDKKLLFLRWKKCIVYETIPRKESVHSHLSFICDNFKS